MGAKPASAATLSPQAPAALTMMLARKLLLPAVTCQPSAFSSAVTGDSQSSSPPRD
jgi:hypothetical protein